MNFWGLPKAALIQGRTIPFNSDYRDILDIIRYMADEALPTYTRWAVALALFYNEEIPEEMEEDAARYLSEFIDYGAGDDGRPHPKLIDWEQDAQMIIADVNKVAGQEVRAVNYLHWWTFMAYFNAIGEGQLSSVVNIRSKRAKGKKLDKSEMEFYRENRKRIDFQTPATPEQKAVKDYFDKWL